MMFVIKKLIFLMLNSYPNGIYISVDYGHPKVYIQDLILLKKRVEARKIKPIIDRCYPLEQMAEAHRYVDQVHKK